MLFTVVDIETTGLSPSYNAVTEIAASRVRDGCIVREFESLVNPEVHIPGFITRLTGISDEMVADAPTIDDVLPAFRKFLGNDIFVAHNASFDYRFLNHNVQKLFGGSLTNDTLCTKLLANRLLPDLYSKKLGVICEHLNIQNSDAHRALGDVRATVGVLNHFCGELKKRALNTSDMLRFQRLPILIGQYQTPECPFCGKRALSMNSQKVPVCIDHKGRTLEEKRCSCGSWLDLRSGKYGPYYNCIKCGNLSYTKGNDRASVVETEKPEKKDEGHEMRNERFEHRDSEQSRNPREIIIRSDDPRYF